ncbi:MAG: hypothetical protein ASARMPREDX12_004419 [Alectoria sarmentosa]|nr:MAG: hypothetical protein ASARMPREDX12_004419 [Alectoria sarmentosa]
MTSSLEKRLAKVNGIVIPSKLPEGQQPLRARRTCPINTNAKLDPDRSKTCPICGYASSKASNIRPHFVACVKTNGNPTGAHWDDNFNFVPRPRLVKRKFNDSDESADTEDSSAPKNTARARRTTEQRDKRQRQYYERLAAVNGVIIASKLAPGETPARRNYEASGNPKHQCPICGGLHNRKYQVQSHFAPCVERNGNPTGARWDDACASTESRSEGVSTRDSSEPQDYQMQDPQPEEYKFADTRVDSAMTDDFPLDSYQDNDPQSASLPSDSFEPYHPDLENLDLYSPSSSSSGFEPYHPDTEDFDQQITSSSSSSFEPYHPGLENLEPQLTFSSSSSFGPYHPDLQFLDLQHAAERPKLPYGHTDQ